MRTKLEFIAQGALTAAMFIIATPGFAQSDQGCSSSGQQPPGCAQGAPAPLIAAGIPGALVLIGGIVAARRARSRRNRAE